MPDMDKIAKSYDAERYRFGESFRQDNALENFAIYNNKFVLFSKGLSEEDISSIFNSTEVKIS